MTARQYDTYNLVAEDLAYWLDNMSTKIAMAMAPRGIAPFAAVLTDGQKLQYWAAQLFNQDGTPNVQGRTNALQLLGPKGFADVYHAVTRAYPNLRIPTPPEEAPAAGPGAAPGGPPPAPPALAGAPAGAPPGIPAMAQGGIVTQPTVALIGEAGPEAVVPLRNGADQDWSHLDTRLNPTDEMAFQRWKAQYAPYDSGADYDLRGAFLEGLTPDPQTGHWPDTYKKPNHPTFSDQSRYAQLYPQMAGHWDGDTFVPPTGLPGLPSGR